MKFEGPSKVVIKRVPRSGYFGIASYAKSVTTLGCELSKNGFKTGLTADEEAYYEKALDLKPGELAKHSKWWGDVFNTTYAIRLQNTKQNELFLDNPISQLKYKVLLSNSKVANSEIEKNDPNAIFYIDNQEAKAKKELETINFKFEGMKLILKLSPEEKKGALRLFGKKGLEDISEDMSSAQLAQEMEKDPKLFFDIMTDKSLSTKAMIFEMIEKGILKRKGNYYIHGEDTIANSTDEVVEYFNDVKNQSVVLALKSRLKKASK